MIEKAPSKISPYKNLLYPFTFSVWYFFILSMIFIFLTFILLATIKNKKSPTNNKTTFVDIVYESLILTVGPIFQEYHGTMRTAFHSYGLISETLLNITWLFSAMLLTLSYGSFLKVSFVLIEYESGSLNFVEAMLFVDEPVHISPTVYNILSTFEGKAFKSLIEKANKYDSILKNG